MNKGYLKSHENITNRVEMDEMRSFYQDKKHQMWLWWVIDHETGEGNSVLVWEEGT